MAGSKSLWAHILNDYLRAASTVRPWPKLVVSALAGVAAYTFRLDVSELALTLYSSSISIVCALLFGLFVPIADHARRLGVAIGEITLTSERDEARLEVERLTRHRRLALEAFAMVVVTIFLALGNVILSVLLGQLKGGTTAVQATAYLLVLSATVTLGILFLLHLVALINVLYYSFYAESAT